jgi:hypothetical protein
MGLENGVIVTTPRWTALLSLIVVGCLANTFTYEVPITTVKYPPREKIDMSVELRLSQEYRDAEWREQRGDIFVLPLGWVLSVNAEDLARKLFVDVTVTRGEGWTQAASVDAVLTPRMLSVERTRPLFGFREQVLTLKLGWTLSDVDGKRIWKDTIQGEGRSVMWLPQRKSQANKQVEMLLEDLFAQSFDAIASSEDIHDFARSRR